MHIEIEKIARSTNSETFQPVLTVWTKTTIPLEPLVDQCAVHGEHSAFMLLAMAHSDQFAAKLKDAVNRR